MNKETTAKPWLWCAGLFALFVILCVAGMYVSVFSTYILNDQEKWGQFGDYFGGVLNPVLSFFAFIALLVTLRMQLVANEDGERRHNEQLKEQRLFQLIGLMNENALSTKIRADEFDSAEAIGHEALHYSLVNLRSSLSRLARIEHDPVISDLELFQTLEYKFKVWRKYYWPAIGLYVDSVFLVLDFILREKSSDSFKQFSLRALRVQLSESERLLLWYSAMFTAEYVIYLEPLQQSGFIDDYEGSLDDQIKPWRERMIQCSRLWSHIEIEKRSTNA